MQLVASYRNQEGQPRQKAIASLGDADLPKEEMRQIAIESEQEQVYRMLGLDWRTAFPPVRTEVRP